MKATQDWLWDRKISTKKAKFILSNPRDNHFLSLVSLLLSRKNTPREVFKIYLKPVLFLQNWNRIKRQMRKDSWNNPRIEFWQAIYEKLKDKYRKNGSFIPLAEITPRPESEFCKLIADKIRTIRKQKDITQVDLAKKLKVSQQVISRIETGKENISILTLKKIVDSLQADLNIDIT